MSHACGWRELVGDLTHGWMDVGTAAAGVQQLGLRRFYCKINEDNAPSIAMFQG